MSRYKNQLDFMVFQIETATHDKCVKAKKEISKIALDYKVERDLIPTKIVKTLNLIKDCLDNENSYRPFNQLPFQQGVLSVAGIPVFERKGVVSINGNNQYLAFNKLFIAEYAKVPVTNTLT